MRVFIGIRIPGDIKKNIEQVEEKLKNKIKEARLVPAGNLHLTLKFLGEVKQNNLERLKAVLQKIARQFQAFEAEIKGLGTFPTGKEIRVMWVGVESGENLKKLNSSIENELETEGYGKEKRFKEHITIARFKALPKLSFVEEVKKKFDSKTFGKYMVDGMELIKSDLTGKGAVYTTIEKFNFGGENNG
jgi:RNA 2',3'-cyclic 3'-phosphodiesterase